MIDIISKWKEKSGFGGGRGEAEGMLGGARVKLIQCKMNRMKGSFCRVGPPQSTSGSQPEREGDLLITRKVSEAKTTNEGYAKYLEDKTWLVQGIYEDEPCCALLCGTVLGIKRSDVPKVVIGVALYQMVTTVDIIKHCQTLAWAPPLAGLTSYRM